MNIRNIEEKDSANLRAFINECKPLGLNTGIAYWMLGRYFNNTCFVLEENNKIVGFATAIISPTKPDTLFFWQLGISANLRGKNYSFLLIDKIVSAAKEFQCKYIEFTIFPNNIASIKTVTSYAKRNNIMLKQKGTVDFLDPVSNEQFIQNLYQLILK